MAVGYQGGNDVVVASAFQPLMRTIERNYQYEQQVKQEQRKEKEALNLSVQKDLAKVNANGLRKVDLQGFNDKYTKVKDTYAKFSTTTDRNEQRRLAMEINSELGDIASYVGQSKELETRYAKELQELPSMVGKGDVASWRRDLDSFKNTPLDKITSDFLDKSKYISTFDSNKANTSIDGSLRKAFDNSANVDFLPTQAGEVISLAGGKREQRITETQRLKDNVVLDTISKLYKTDTNVKGLVDAQLESGQAADLNQAIAQVAEIHSDVRQQSKVRNVNPDKAAPTTIINPNSEAEDKKYFKTKIGNFTSNEASTYKTEVPLFGTRDVITKDGTRYELEFEGEVMKGGTLLELPVDENGIPLKTNSNGKAVEPSKVKGYGEFLAGLLPSPESIGNPPSRNPRRVAMNNRTALLPMSNIQWIGTSKPKTKGLEAKQGRGSTGQTKTTQTDDEKFN